MLFIIFNEEKPLPTKNFKVLLQEKEYNWAIPYQIKKGFFFNIYK